MNKALIILIAIQICAIGYILTRMYHKNISITPLSSVSTQEFPVKDLSHFYELKANTTIKDTADWIPGGASHTINADSLNERYNYNTKKEKNVFRIITLGDSFTYGLFVDTKDNWTELLEDELNAHHTCDTVKKYEVINLGVSGYDLAYATERYILRGKKYEPDALIMLIVEFGRVTEHRIINKGKIVLSQKEIEAYKKQGQYAPETLFIDNLLSTDSRIKYQEKYFHILTSQYHNKIMLVDFEQNPLYEKTLERLVGTSNAVSIQKTKLSWDDTQYFFPDGHPNKEGHEKLMDEILHDLSASKILPCN
jgi:lysophospholipase L1-like esterase